MTKGKKKLHLVKWPDVGKRRKFGGLGVKSLRKMNKALLSKWQWRFAIEKTALWRSIIAEKYGTEALNWFSKYPTVTYGRSLWKGIMKCSSIFRSHIRFKVNYGTGTRFWMDNWLTDEPLHSKYPNLFVVSREKNLTVAEVYGVLEDH